jgi:glycosyltransferase involved in cell wall biosynthesis
LSAPSENLASRTIVESGAGMVVSASNRDAFSSAVLRKLDDPDWRRKCGLLGRAYSEKIFGIGQICDRFIRSIAECSRDASE